MRFRAPQLGSMGPEHASGRMDRERALQSPPTRFNSPHRKNPAFQPARDQKVAFARLLGFSSGQSVRVPALVAPVTRVRPYRLTL
jgi:hypothetical protein